MTATSRIVLAGSTAAIFAVASIGFTSSVNAEPRLNEFAAHLQGLNDPPAPQPQLRIGAQPGCRPNAAGCTYVYPDFDWAFSGYSTLVISGQHRP